MSNKPTLYRPQFKWQPKHTIAAVALATLLTGAVVLSRKKNRKKELEILGNGFTNFYGENKILYSPYPRGVRNNNPGNIIKSSEAWQGKIPHDLNTDGHFEQFYSYTDGVRALVLQLRTDIATHGRDTIRKLLNKYAPSFENNTEAYIQKVAKEAGKTPDQQLSADAGTLRQIATLIIEVENGLQKNGYAYVRTHHMNNAFKLIKL